MTISFETTWGWMFKNADSGRDIEVLRAGSWQELSYLGNSYVDGNGTLHMQEFTIYFALLSDGEFQAVNENEWVNWRYKPDEPVSAAPTAPTPADDHMDNEPPCSYCGKYCRRDPVDCEDLGGTYPEDDEDEYICWECGLPEDACICDIYDECAWELEFAWFF